MEKIFLALIGTVYVALAIWCAVMPGKTSEVVGFDLKPGSGQSEYIVIYGGLQLALGLVFFVPLVNSEAISFALLTCLIVHGAIVFFRTIAFFMYSGFSNTTYTLAVCEWVILIATAVIYWRFSA